MTSGAVSARPRLSFVSESRRVLAQAAPLRQQVVEVIRRDIIDADLPPGARLLESAMCERYGVSRTVIREALRQLEAERLVTVLPNRGPVVTVLTVPDVESLYDVRRALEGLAGELFAERATAEEARALRDHIAAMEADYVHGDQAARGRAKDRFYELLVDGAHNEVLREDLHRVHSRIGIFRYYAFLDQTRVVASMAEVRAIAHAAAELRDPVAARKACEDHIARAGALAVVEYRAHHLSQAVPEAF